jgi:PIN like domain
VTDEPSVRFFVDENSLVLGRLLARQRHDVVHPGHRLFPEVPVGSKDDVWLPIVGERGLILITRDKKIRSRPIERARLIEAGVRGFVLTGAGDMDSEQMLQLVDDRWAEIDHYIADHPIGPWLASSRKAASETSRCQALPPTSKSPDDEYRLRFPHNRQYRVPRCGGEFIERQAVGTRSSRRFGPRVDA